jgi:hypothetical protein
VKLTTHLPRKEASWICPLHVSLEFIRFSFKGKKIKFIPEQAMKAQRGSRGIALLFL